MVFLQLQGEWLITAMDAKVSLAEALEVRDGPLEESELWGVLCQAAEAVQDLFLRSKSAAMDTPVSPYLSVFSGDVFKDLWQLKERLPYSFITKCSSCSNFRLS